MISKMSLTCLTAVDLAAAEIGIVSQPHDAGPHGETRKGLVWWVFGGRKLAMDTVVPFKFRCCIAGIVQQLGE